MLTLIFPIPTQHCKVHSGLSPFHIYNSLLWRWELCKTTTLPQPYALSFLLFTSVQSPIFLKPTCMYTLVPESKAPEAPRSVLHHHGDVCFVGYFSLLRLNRNSNWQKHSAPQLCPTQWHSNSERTALRSWWLTENIWVLHVFWVLHVLYFSSFCLEFEHESSRCPESLPSSNPAWWSSLPSIRMSFLHIKGTFTYIELGPPNTRTCKLKFSKCSHRIYYSLTLCVSVV